MLRTDGRFEGEIREFSLYDQGRERNKKFIVYAEWLKNFTVEGATEEIITGWISQCRYCRTLRCLVVQPAKEKWICLKCQRKGTLKKPEEKKESTKKKRDPQGKKVLNCLLKERQKE